MVSLPIFNRSGEEVGTYDLDPAEIAPSISKQLLHDAVVMYQANQRQGTHRTKTRGEVAGSTKKMYRQKGTGNARAGSKRSGIRRGGGHIFAIRPRDYSYRLNKKALRAATRMAIVSKIESQQVVVLEDWGLADIKTKAVADTLKALSLYGKRVMIAIEGYNDIVYRSARNIDRVSVSPVSELNALTVLHPHKVVITKAALDALRSKGAGGGNGSGEGDDSANNDSGEDN